MSHINCLMGELYTYVNLVTTVSQEHEKDLKIARQLLYAMTIQLNVISLDMEYSPGRK